jgi:hypothetical protein
MSNINNYFWHTTIQGRNLMCNTGGISSNKAKFFCFLGQQGISLTDSVNNFGFKTPVALLYLTDGPNNTEIIRGSSGTPN